METLQCVMAAATLAPIVFGTIWISKLTRPRKVNTGNEVEALQDIKAFMDDVTGGDFEELAPGIHDVTPRGCRQTVIVEAWEVDGDVQGEVRGRPPAGMKTSGATSIGTEGIEKLGKRPVIKLNGPKSYTHMIAEPVDVDKPNGYWNFFGVVIYRPKGSTPLGESKK